LLYKVAEAFTLLLFFAWVPTNKSSSLVVLTFAYLFSYVNNDNCQQAAAHNVVVEKLNGIEESLCEI
jgi:hypothetical protein